MRGCMGFEHTECTQDVIGTVELKTHSSDDARNELGMNVDEAVWS